MCQGTYLGENQEFIIKLARKDKWIFFYNQIEHFFLFNTKLIFSKCVLTFTGESLNSLAGKIIFVYFGAICLVMINYSIHLWKTKFTVVY